MRIKIAQHPVDGRPVGEALSKQSEPEVMEASQAEIVSGPAQTAKEASETAPSVPPVAMEGADIHDEGTPTTPTKSVDQ